MGGGVNGLMGECVCEADVEETLSGAFKAWVPLSGSWEHYNLGRTRTLDNRGGRQLLGGVKFSTPDNFGDDNFEG